MVMNTKTKLPGISALILFGLFHLPAHADPFSDAANKVNNAVNQGGQAVQGAANAGGQAAQGAISNVVDGAQNAVNQAGQSAQDAGNSAGQAGQNAGRQGGRAAEIAGQQGRQAMQRMNDDMSQLHEMTKQVMQSTSAAQDPGSKAQSAAPAKSLQECDAARVANSRLKIALSSFANAAASDAKKNEPALKAATLACLKAGDSWALMNLAMIPMYPPAPVPTLSPTRIVFQWPIFQRDSESAIRALDALAKIQPGKPVQKAAGDLKRDLSDAVRSVEVCVLAVGKK